MVHDITATHNGVDVAYNRRAAGNPRNQVLYLALGVMDQAYAGCSGGGVEIDITVDQFRAAREILETKNFDDMTRERNMADEIVDSFRRMGMSIHESTDIGLTDISQEKDFIDACIEFCEENRLPSLQVFFW